MKSLRNFTKLKNCAHVELILCKATKKQLFSSRDGWRSNHNYFQLRPGTSWYKEIRNSSIKYELNCQWNRANIDNWYSVCITMEYLPKNRAKVDDLCFLERCSLLCWILSIWPLLLVALQFGIASMQIHRHLSVGCMLPCGTWRYINKDNFPCRLVKLSKCMKILSRLTYSYLLQLNIPRAQATKITFLLKLR